MTDTHYTAHTPWGAEKVFTVRTEKEGDVAVIEEVFESDTYRIGEMKTAPTTVFDIGGHIGTFTCTLKTRFPDVRVWIIEPHPRSVDLIRKNVEEYGDSVTVIHGAISYTHGNRLADGHVATGGGFILSEDRFLRKEPERTREQYHLLEEVVPTYTIEQLFEIAGIDSIDLTKWDCEGGEVDAFKNMTTESAERFRDMVGEYHGAGGFKSFEAMARNCFPDHTFETRKDDVPDNYPIGWFKATVK